MDNTSKLVKNEQSSICKCSVQQRPGANGNCCLITDVPIEVPDLAIYSQSEQLAAGLVPSWDNPDITTNDWGPFRLRPEAQVIVRNLSATVPAVNALVHYYISPFGIGMQRTLKQTSQVNIGAGQQVPISFILDQATLAGDQRIGVHIEIEHPKDANQNNNKGSQVHNGAYTTESGRSFDVAIPVFNDSPLSRLITLSIMPTDMLASLSLVSHNFLPHEQIIVRLHIDVPAPIVGTAANMIQSQVTVIGRLADNSLVGGVTHLLRINN